VAIHGGLRVRRAVARSGSVPAKETMAEGQD